MLAARRGRGRVAPMADWELYDGERTLGPKTEAEVLEELRRGALPTATVIREAGSGSEWRHIRTHAPFAMALASPPATAASAHVTVSNVVTTRPQTSCVTMGCAVLAALGLLFMIFAGIRSWL